MSKLITMLGMLSVMALGSVAQAADRCKPGGDCCKPTAPCCKKSGALGRVTTIFPGEACLFCRGRITPEMIAFEMLPEAQQQVQIERGYAPELRVSNPAVVPFTTTVAATAVTEVLHRLTGFMGADRHSTEVLQSFDMSRIKTNRETPDLNCGCADRGLWGSGDSERFLGMWA